MRIVRNGWLATFAVAIVLMLGALAPAAQATCTCSCYWDGSGGDGSPFFVCDRGQCSDGGSFAACCSGCRKGLGPAPIQEISQSSPTQGLQAGRARAHALWLEITKPAAGDRQ